MTKSLLLPPQTSIYLYIFILVFVLAACSTSSSEAIPTYIPVASNTSTPPVATPTKPTATNVITDTAKPTLTSSPSTTQEPSPLRVQSLPGAGDYTWQVIAEGFKQLTGLVSSLDGSGRLFATEQAGLIHILQEGELLPTPFLDLRDRVSTTGSTTAGLLGLAFHPNHVENGYFYIHYTESGGDSVIARYEITEDPNVGDPTSELRLVEISFPIGEHRGGDLVFGLDGYLYISIGDGGAHGYADQAGNAQDPRTFPGSILRIDVDSKEPYDIPPGNPFITGGGLPEVWAYGLRNPWRFSIDRLTGDMYIADVGENHWEEINFLPAGTPGGANFGWSYMEGSEPFKENLPEPMELTLPVVEYDHTQGCSVTGGVVYRGTALPDWYGVYLYGDFCQGNIWGLLEMPDGSWENELLFIVPAFITSFGQDDEGEVYIVGLTGKIYKLVRK